MRDATVFTVLRFSEITNKLRTNAADREFWRQHFLLKPIGGKRLMPKSFLKITNHLTATQPNMSRLSSSDTRLVVLFKILSIRGLPVEMIHKQLLEALPLVWEAIPHSSLGKLWHFVPSGVVGLAGAELLSAKFGCYITMIPHYYLNFQCVPVLGWINFIRSCLYWSSSMRKNREWKMGEIGPSPGLWSSKFIFSSRDKQEGTRVCILLAHDQ